MDTAIHASGLTKTFKPASADPVQAVDHIDLTVDAGEIVAFLGPNGAGKTTTIDMILALTEPTSGTVTTCGMTPRQAIRQGKVGAVLQSGGLLRDLSVRETVEVIAAQYPGPTDVDAVLDRAGIARLAKRKVGKCSGGEQQRLRFALALLPDPELLILDEPTAGMDVTARHDFWDTMRGQRHRTVLFATHYLEEAATFADRIVLMNHGRIVADGTTHEIRSLTKARTVSFAAPPRSGLPDALRLRPEVREVTERDGRFSVSTSDSDALLRLVLDGGGHDIEVSAPSLDAAFIALTREN